MISLDGTASIWIFGILVFAIGLTLGCIATYLAVARYGRTRELQEELDQLKEGFTEYRDQVTQHFMRTSELVQEMTQSYRAVYEHLASGAQHLCGEGVEINRLVSGSQGRLAGARPEAAAGDPDGPAMQADKADDYLEDILGDSPRISDLDLDIEPQDARQPRQH